MTTPNLIQVDFEHRMKENTDMTDQIKMIITDVCCPNCGKPLCNLCGLTAPARIRHRIDRATDRALVAAIQRSEANADHS